MLKLGLSRDADFELALAPLVVVQNSDKATGQRTRSTGFGDIYTRVKINLIGNDNGDYVLSVVPYIKAPTAGSTIGNGSWEGGVYAPFVVLLPDDWYLDITSEIDILENATRDGTHSNFQNLINLSHTMFGGTTTALVEIWSDVNTDRNTPTQYTLDFAIAWPNPRRFAGRWRHQFWPQQSGERCAALSGTFATVLVLKAAKGMRI